VIQGLRAAQGTLRLQMPYFVQICPEMNTCYTASINLSLEFPLRIENPDFTTPPIPWAGPPGEVFSFLKISLEAPIGALRRKAWIYIPHGSPHFDNVFQVEILSEFVREVSYGAICQIHIPREHRESRLILV